ncbi:MAG: DNA recombination protein RmuC [Chloroflexi bacterium]|nr:DNA recombination protein RmuC [Chloroflexota bacterium]
MNTLLLAILVILMIGLSGAVLVVLYLQLRKPQGATDLSTPLQNLTQAIQSTQTQTAVLAQRVSSIEQNQSVAGQSIQGLSTQLTQASTATSSLMQTADAIRTELSRASEGLAQLKTHASAREEVERRTADSIRRLETIIAGTQSRGAAGENILEMVFAKLPPEWQVRDFTVGGKPVEFGLRLPNNLILPIDSKWTAANLLEQFVSCDNVDEQVRLKGQIESAVVTKAKEVKKYIDPSVTVNFGVAAVPDAVYDLCCGIQADIFQLNVVLVSYSMFVPYLLLVFQTVLKTSQNIDIEHLERYLQAVQTSVKALQEELDGRFSRSLTMLSNSRDDMRAHLSKVSSGITGLQLSSTTPGAPVAPLEPRLEVVQGSGVTG